MKKFRNKTYVNLLSQVVGLLVAVFGVCACEEEYDHTIDTANPVIVSYNPVADVEDVAVSSNLVLTFDEYVQKGSGVITIASETDTQTVSVSSEAVVIGDDARVVTINPDDFVANQQYWVTMDQGVFTDLLGNAFMGIPQDVSWTFTTAGATGPIIAVYSPEDGSSDGSLFKLSATFTSEIKEGEGNIYIYMESGDLVSQMAITSQAVTISEDELEVSLSAPLEFATAYYVNIDEGAILDADDNSFNGISDNTTWNFTTTPGSSTSLVVYLPFDEDLSDESGNVFDATLGESASADIDFVTDAERGKVIQFNAGSYVQLPQHDYLRPSETQDFSVNVWVKLAGIGSDPVLWGNKDWGSGSNPGILLCTSGGDTYDAADPSSDGSGWIINMNGSGDGSSRVDWKASETTTRASSISDEQWHMVTVVVDRTNELLYVYLDGTAYSYMDGKSLSGILGPLWDATNDYPFCIWEDGTGQYNANSDTRKALAGMMDEFRMYNKALSATEVENLYND